MAAIRPSLHDLIMDDSIDEELTFFVYDAGAEGCSINSIVEKFGVLGNLRAGWLSAKGVFEIIAGGGDEPYVLRFKETT